MNASQAHFELKELARTTDRVVVTLVTHQHGTVYGEISILTDKVVWLREASGKVIGIFLEDIAGIKFTSSTAMNAFADLREALTLFAGRNPFGLLTQ